MRATWGLILRAVIALAPLAAPALALAQANPVYLDDSPAAADTLAALPAQVRAGQLDQAVRQVQRLLREDADRVTPSSWDSEVFISVRARVHEAILSQPALAEHYRRIEGPKAERVLRDGDAGRVEREWLLTPAGFDAALQIARGHLERAQFHAARLAVEQLEPHPDFAARSARAAAVLAEIGRYLDDPRLHATIRRWGADPGAPVVWPARAARRGAWTFSSVAEGEGGIGVAGLDPPEVPLATSAYTRPSNMEDWQDPRGGENERRPRRARDLPALVTVADDLLYVSDGTLVRALDRYTLQPRWTIDFAPRGSASDPDEDAGAAMRRQIRRVSWSPAGDDLTAVAVRSGVAVFVSEGLASPTGEEPTARVHAADARTGELLWTVALRDIDPALERAWVRGPVLLDEGVAVLTVRRSAPEQRLLGLYLIGLDVSDGRVLWKRLGASTGMLPFASRYAEVSDGGVLDRGIVYRPDRLGAVVACEAVTGRVVWVRRMGVTSQGIGDQARVWEMSLPVIDPSDPAAGGLIVLTPDRLDVVRLDQATARITHRRGADRFGWPRRFVRAGDSLVAVCKDRLMVTPLAEFSTADPAEAARFETHEINGRVAAVGSCLLVPTVTGASLVELPEPHRAPEPAGVPAAARVRALPLEFPGNVLPLANELIVVDDDNVHAYVRWDVAERMAMGRMNDAEGAAGGDGAGLSAVGAAATYAELALRAAKPDAFLTALDAGASVVARDERSRQGNAEQARRRLFELARAAVETPLDRLDELPAPVLAAPDNRAAPEDNPQEQMHAAPGPLEATSFLRSVTSRLASLARTPEEQAAARLLGARVRVREGDFAAAVRELSALARADSPFADAPDAGAIAPPTPTAPPDQKRAPAEPGAGDAGRDRAARLLTWSSPHASATVAQEAVTRLGQALRAADQATRDDYERAAASALQRARGDVPLAPPTPAGAGAAPPQAPPETRARLERFASSYPWSAAARTAHAELASLISPDSNFALRQVHARAAAPDSTDPAAPPAFISPSAAPPVSAAWTTFSGLSGASQAFPGWAIAEELLWDQRPTSPAGRTTLVLQNPERIAIARRRPVPPASPAPGATSPLPAGHAAQGEFEIVWTEDLTDGPARLVRIDEPFVDFYLSTPEGARLLRADASTGQVVWRTGVFPSMFEPDSVLEARLASVVGVVRDVVGRRSGERSLGDLFVAATPSTIYLVERTGRAAAIETGSGSVLWARRLGIDRVYDIAAAGDRLALIGERERSVSSPAAPSLTGAIELVREIDGSSLASIATSAFARPRLVRAVVPDAADPSTAANPAQAAPAAGVFVVAFERGLAALSTRDAAPVWGVGVGAAAECEDAWVVHHDDAAAPQGPAASVIVLAADQTLWAIDPATGQIRGSSLQTMQRLHTGPPIGCFELPPGRFAFTSNRGVLIYDAACQLRGADGLTAEDLLLPQPVAGGFVALDLFAPTPVDDARYAFALHLLDNDSAKVVETRPIALDSAPTRMSVVDGCVVLSTQRGAVVLFGRD